REDLLNGGQRPTKKGRHLPGLQRHCLRHVLPRDDAPCSPQQHGASFYSHHDGRSVGGADLASLLCSPLVALRDAADRHLEAPYVTRAGYHRYSRVIVNLMSLRDVFERQPQRRYIMFGGKGGLGKTTLSATCTYWLARQGKRMLLFSVDPQASLSDIFERDIFGKGAVPIFDAVVDIIVKGDYDYYIYDLVPLGHALSYLSMAKVYDEWINKITKLREEMGQYDRVAATLRRQEKVEEDKILEELRYIKSRINTSSQILTDKQKTAFFFVLAPEEMIILDTRKAAELFARFDVPISGYVVNRVLPQELRRDNIPTYLKNRIQ